MQGQILRRGVTYHEHKLSPDKPWNDKKFSLVMALFDLLRMKLGLGAHVVFVMPGHIRIRHLRFGSPYSDLLDYFGSEEDIRVLVSAIYLRGEGLGEFQRVRGYKDAVLRCLRGDDPKAEPPRFSERARDLLRYRRIDLAIIAEVTGLLRDEGDAESFGKVIPQEFGVSSDAVKEVASMIDYWYEVRQAGQPMPFADVVAEWPGKPDRPEWLEVMNRMAPDNTPTLRMR